MVITADSTLWTADTICVTADGRVICMTRMWSGGSCC